MAIKAKALPIVELPSQLFCDRCQAGPLSVALPSADRIHWLCQPCREQELQRSVPVRSRA